MKKLTILLVMLFAIISLIGCDDGSDGQGDGGSEQLMPDNVELLGAARHYGVESFKLDIDIDFMQVYFFIHQGELHLFLLAVDEDTLNSYIHLLTMDVDGSNVQELYRTPLNENVDFFRILGFEKHDNGYITIVSTDNMILPPYTREDYFDGLWDFEINYSYIYRRVSPNGEIMSEIGIDALNNEERHIRVLDVAFDLEGNAVASASWLPADFDISAMGGVLPQGIGGQSFFLFDNGITGDFHEVEDEAFSTGLFNRTHGGQIITPSFAHIGATASPILYEIDFENTAIVDGTVIDAESPIESISGVLPAPKVSVFDFYVISDGRELFGYNNADGTFTLLLDFLELGVPLNHWRLDRNSVLLWDDGRITTVNINWNASLRREEVTVFHLTPSAEPKTVIEREIITLTGVDVNATPLMDLVTVFNRQSDTHKIEVVNYSYDDMDRLRTELIAGRGPDIFMLSWWGTGLFAALAEGHFLFDLYQMIDADPDINREDFFPTVLSTWENSRGELVKIAPSFSIQTIMGMQSDFPEASGNWNYADFIAFYEYAREVGYDYPFGQTIDRQVILNLLLFADDTFFCEQTAVANFDSESFINVLNFVMTIPADQGWGRVLHLSLEGLWDSVGELLRGEQLLLFGSIIDPLDFRTLQMRLGGITAFGFPSNDAPIHAVLDATGTAVGIRSNSPHIEAAWEFVRHGLLPGNLGAFHDRLAFPLRIDQFEQLIYRELSRTAPTEIFWSGGFLEVPPLTESDAELLHDIISNIGHKPMVEHPIQNIVNEDVGAFFAGTRSAEDTARIIQSRVQIFLSERAR